MNRSLASDAPPAEQRPSANSPVDKSGGRVRDMFRQVAPRYDLMNHLLSLNIDRLWRKSAVDQLKIDGDWPILDVCTGTGDLALAIKRRAGTRVQVIGSDFCRAMLNIAHAKSRGAEASQALVDYLEADSLSLPFSNNTFQCVTVAFGLRNVSDTNRGLAEMLRVCRPGGQVMILEFSRPTAIGFKQLYQFYFANILPRVGNFFARNDKSAYKYLQESVLEFPDGQKLVDRMEGVGITQCQFTPLTFGVATIYVGTKSHG